MTGLRFSTWLTLPLLVGASLAHAIPPPPPEPPQLRQARMTVTIKLVEASHGRVSKITPLCKVSGTIPVYADDGRLAGFHGREIEGCKMPCGDAFSRDVQIRSHTNCSTPTALSGTCSCL